MIHICAMNPRLILLLIGLVFASGCAVRPPDNPDNLCDIFEENRAWYKASTKAAKRWNGPVHVPMAIIYQESGFKAKAKPPRRYLLGFIPAGRKSSAYGYSQAKSPAWQDYKKATGNRGADRDNFADAVDFVQWYMDKTAQINKVSKWDTKAQYLNYHEGWGGYRRATYRSKDWLLGVANKVDRRALAYAEQYRGCEKNLSRGWLWRLLF